MNNPASKVNRITGVAVILDTDDEKNLELIRIAIEMKRHGFPRNFIEKVCSLSLNMKGLYSLLRNWADVNDKEKKDEYLIYIEELMADAEQMELPLLNNACGEKSDLAALIRDFKTALRKKVLAVGLTKVAKSAGIPQPSLSRLLNPENLSMPRISTLTKIGRVLNLKEEEYLRDWMY